LVASSPGSRRNVNRSSRRNLSLRA
jgi:hypothetical protein